jgi:pyrimidine operon attenuation protein/uracil phosphoribosyltransferase
MPVAGDNFLISGGNMQKQKIILTEKAMERTLDRLASEIAERRGDNEKLAIIGIQRRGADLAERLKKSLDEALGRKIPLGKLDINLYRDDWTTLTRQPSINCTEIPFDIEDASVILVDDVLFSGRTVRAALEAVLDFGRPRRVELLVLVDRGHRELPISADYVGKKIDTYGDEHVNVFVRERDEKDCVVLVS